MKAIQQAEHTQTMVNGLGSGLRLLAELMADVIDQSRLIDVGNRGCRMLLEPAREVQEIIGIGTHGTEGKLANSLRIKEGIGSGDLLPLVIDQTIGRTADGQGRFMDKRNAHSDFASFRQVRKSAAVAPAAK